MKRTKTDLRGDFRAAFAASGMTRLALSKQTGVSYSVIHRFIAGERDLTLRTASKLADVLGLELRQSAKRKGR